jgi:outer membrane protein OmpA-like peptidoglycan-associated protein
MLATLNPKLKHILTFAICALSCAGISSSLPHTAHAQDGFQVDQFEPAYDQDSNILNTYGSDVIEAPQYVDFSAGVFYHYAHVPLKIVNLNDDSRQTLIDSQHKVEPWIGLGLFNFFDIGVVIPLVFSKKGEATSSLTANMNDFALGDIRITPKFRILDQEKFGGFGLAVAAPLYLPTGDEGSFTGQGSFRAEPRLILDFTFPFGLKFAANVGYQFRDSQTIADYVNDQLLRWSFATEIPLGSRDLRLIGTIFGDAKFSENIDPRDPTGTTDGDSSSNYPVELLGALRFNPIWGLQTQIGGGGAVTQGVGAPEFRLLASVGYQHQDGDTDGDGLLDSVDNCDEQPEDKDLFKDEDGCPDPDNDEDTVLDVAPDQCATEKEDLDQFEDTDGCPDPDNDKDKIPDTIDTCANEPEDMDGFEDGDGCPDPDNDKDNLCDAALGPVGSEPYKHLCQGADQCPNDPEDKDKFKDDDGCPDLDNDEDGFCDPIVAETGIKTFICQGSDKCPDQKEIVNGVDDTDGCPDEGKPAITVEGDKIELNEQIFFDSGKATIKAVSFGTLDQVATVLNTTPRILRIRVEGHTDDVGDDKKNLQLSKDRAASVMAYLVKKGIDPARLSSEGYGEDSPLIDPKGLKKKDLNDARAQNRRVEIKILELAPAPGQTPAPK